MSARERPTDWPWVGFYLEHRRSLHAYALALTGNAADAQDLLQDVMVRLASASAVPGSRRAYVMRAMRNAAIDRRRRSEARAEAQVPAFDAGAAIHEDEPRVERRETAARVRRVLRRLAQEQQEVILLRVYGELTFAEIAAVLGVPPGTVSSHYRRGLDELGRLLGGVLQDV